MRVVPTPPARNGAVLAAAACVLAACGGGEPVQRTEAPAREVSFNHTIPASGSVVCPSVKRALLSQGYMLVEQQREAGYTVGKRESQQDEKTNIAIRVQAGCVQNSDGSSTVYATGQREVSKLQRVPRSISAGVSIATVTLPTGGEEQLTVVSRETITDPAFYRQFYQLVETYVTQEQQGAPQAASALPPLPGGGTAQDGAPQASQLPANPPPPPPRVPQVTGQVIGPAPVAR
jgi:hypothetical protein